MTIAEFKAWFDGFCAGLDGAPTEEQFAKIREAVAQVQAGFPMPALPSPVSPSWPAIPPIHDPYPLRWETICGTTDHMRGVLT